MFKLFSREMMKVSRFLFLIGAASLCVTAHADETIYEGVTLTEDTDWRSKGKVTIERGVTVNLNGHKLTVSGLASAKGTPLTDLTSPDGAASTPTTLLSGDIRRVFNDKPTNDDGGRIDVKPSALPLIVDYDFGEGNEKVVNMYKVYCHPNASLRLRCPKTWYFYGSNDGSNWTELDSRLSETEWSTSLECRIKTFENTTAYRHYRIKFTANNGDGDTLQITQLEYFSTASFVDPGTVSSGPIVDLTQPGGAASTPCDTWGDNDGVGFTRGTADRVFNDKPARANGRFAVSRVGGKFNMIVDYDFGEDNEQVVNMYKVHSEPTNNLWNRCPKSWVFYGSNNGTDWMPLHSCSSETGWSTDTKSRTRAFENTTAYRHYRIEFTANNGDGDALEITQLEYFSTATFGEHPATISSASIVDLTQPSGGASTPTAITGDIGRVFNDKPTNNEGGRIDVKPSALPLIIDYDFGEGNEKVVDIYKVYCHPNASLPRRCPKTWYFYGSNDGINWTELDSRLSETGWSSSLECRTKMFDNTTAYRHYRIKFTANNGDGDTLQITQLEYFSTLSAGELRLDVPADVVVNNHNVVISDCVRLVKDGAGTFIASKPDQTYYGGTHVVAGTFKCGEGFSVDELGTKPSVVVEKDAVFDVNGWRNIRNYGITLAGGTLTNSGSDFSSGEAQIQKLTLTADSYVDIPHSLGMIAPNYDVSRLDLGGYTLYLNVDANASFYIANTESVSSGTIKVVENAGILSFYKTESRLPSVNLDVTGRVTLGCNVKVGGLRLDANTVCEDQSYKFQVYGKLALLNDAYSNVELQDGATLDFSERTGALNVVSQLANQQLTFVPNATVALDFGTRPLKDFGNCQPGKGRKVIEWTETPPDLQSKQFKVKANGKDLRVFVTVADDGLYLWSGQVILIR